MHPTHTTTPTLPLVLLTALVTACGNDDLPSEVEGSDGGASTSGMSTTTSSPSDASATSLDGGSTTAGPMPCMGNEDCPDAAAPLCEPASGECVGCDATEGGDAACAELDAAAPLCVGERCVECTVEDPSLCDEQLLVCDGETNACAPCTEHAQCDAGACDISEGRCFPEDFVVTVDGDAGAMADYTSVAAAVNAVDDGLHGVIVVHGLDMDAPYAGQVLVGGAKTIALIAAPGELPIIQGTGMNPGLRIEGIGTNLYVDGLQVSGATQTGIVVDESFAWVDRSRIVANSGGGVLVQNGADLTLRNCFVDSSGNGISAMVLDGGSATVLYTTMFSSAFAPTAALDCLAAEALVLRNSIVVTEGGVPGDEFGCGGSNTSYSATEFLVPGDGNVATGPFPDGTPEQWFLDVTTGDLGLQNQGITTFRDVGQWQTGDPTTDINGDLRPTVDGTPDYAGADIPPR